MKLNKSVPYVIAIILFLIIGFAYMSPVLQGKRLSPIDAEMFKGMSKEIQDFREETGEESLWTNRQFGGMPAYLISVIFKGELLKKVQNQLTSLPHPVNFVFINFLMFFILCLLLRNNVWISFAGALAYGLFSFFFIIFIPGHNTKAHTLTYMALVVGGVLLAYKEKPIAGSVITAIGLSWMISANHPQMYYYAGIMVVIIALTYMTAAIRDKAFSAFMKTSVLLLVALVLAVGANFGRLYTTWEYGKFSTRGKSELVKDHDNQTSGLDRNYILDYSYDLGEVMTSFIPRFKGGGMSEALGENSAVFRFMEENQDRATAKRISSGLPLYWGSQPISFAPFYFGAVLCFLFIFGLFVVKGKDKWWIVAVVIVAFLLSLGKNFPLLTNLMIDYFPGYNKFRDVKNIIVIQQFAMALMGVLAVREIYLRGSKQGGSNTEAQIQITKGKQNISNGARKGSADNVDLLKKLSYAWYIVGGLALVFVLFPGLAGDFRAASDVRLAQSGWPDQLLEALRDDRRMVLRNDAFRSFIFVSLTAGVIWLYIKQKLKAKYALVLWVALILTDMWPVNKRYLNNSNFEPKSKFENPFKASKADQVILSDSDQNFRVLNLTVDVFNDASTSYFHNSLGGYHGAKMKRYQELIEHRLYPEIQELITSFKNPSSIDSVMQALPAINMLNTRYIIYNPESAPLENNNALGNAWFVDDMQVVDNANEEIDALGNFDLSETAIVDQRFTDQLNEIQFGGGRESSIQLLEYRPNYLKYKARVSRGTPLAVFSEIWYPKGWKAFIDGKETEYIRANYLLRAMPVPAGEHEIEFRFDPDSYRIGNKVSLASSLILILVFAAVAYAEIKRQNGKKKTSGGH